MALTSQAMSNPRNFYSGVLGTTLTTLYTAPANSANVTSPSATGYIKEIIICNYSASAATVTINVNGQPIMSGFSMPAKDTKPIGGLNTMIPAGATITALAGTASSIALTISGVEVQ